MKIKLSRLLIASAISASALLATSPSEAYWVHCHSGYYHHHRHCYRVYRSYPAYYSYYGYSRYHRYDYYRGYHCRWVSGYYAYGMWYPTRKVCWLR
jgi:hypothetical protein